MEKKNPEKVFAAVYDRGWEVWEIETSAVRVISKNSVIYRGWAMNNSFYETEKDAWNFINKIQNKDFSLN